MTSTRYLHLLTDAEFKAAHKNGATVRQVAALDGVTESSITRRAPRLGIKFCNKPGAKPKTELHAQARELRAQGLSFEKIGDRLGCSGSAAWWWCQ